jgi:hypothetical protein
MQSGRAPYLISLGVGLVFAGCGGSKTAPTADPPSISCPIAPDAGESLDGAAINVSFPSPTITGGQAPLTTNWTPVSGSA